MTYTYVQSTGEMFDGDGGLVETGYAGRGAGLNNPAMQNVHEIGPLPCGWYTCGDPVNHTRLGPDAIPLDPDKANDMFTRGGFYLQADNAAMNRSASEGCIVLRDRSMYTPGTRIQVVSAVPAVLV